MATEADQLLGTLNDGHHRRSEERMNRSNRLTRMGLMSVFVVILGMFTVFLKRANDHNDEDSTFQGTRFNALGGSIYPSLSSSHEETKKKEKHNCDDGKYSHRTLKKAYEMPFSALFKDSRGQKRFEASDVIKVGDELYAVCDSSWAISKFGSSLLPFAETNLQIGDPDREADEESGYEGIVHSDGLFYVVRESVLHPDGISTKVTTPSYHAIVEELKLSDNDYDIVAKCRSEFEFEGNSKGFEGAIGIKDLQSTLTILGLCEGNHCSEERKGDRGNGRLVAMQKSVAGDDSCIWTTVKVIDVPHSANFLDYSAITVDENGRVAISSQEDSKIWIGNLVGKQDNGLYDLDELALVDSSDDGKEVYDFPMNDDCDVVYCNIEGIHWLDENILIAVSDKMKSKGKQAFRCFDKDQSVHAFVLP